MIDDENDSKEIKRVMFGDPFGKRGDYSKGLFYGGRRQFLHRPGIDSNPMKPTEEFMTIKQARNAIRNKNKVTLEHRIEFKKVAVEENLVYKSQKQESIAAKKKQSIFYCKYPSTAQVDWTEKMQAGCKYWQHNETGMVTNECPFEEEETNVYSESSLPTHLEGTGALVYDNQEFENFMRDLDSINSSLERK